MCGRFTQNYTWEQVHAFLSVFGPPRNLQPHYNIAPTDTVDVIRLDKHGARELVSMRWGLVPAWWKKSLKEVPVTFNARAESVADKPMFRTAFKERRCIVPASGFFEWTGGKGAKQPHLFTAADGSPLLAFAGLGTAGKTPHRRMASLLHDHRIRCFGLDGALSRPHAGAFGGEGFRRLARRLAWSRGAQTGAGRGAARVEGVAASQQNWRWR